LWNFHWGPQEPEAWHFSAMARNPSHAHGGSRRAGQIDRYGKGLALPRFH
jgi:hypothetical protein